MRVYTLRWTRTANRFRQSTKAFTEAFYPLTPTPLRYARTMTPALAAWALISQKHLHHSLAVAHSPDYLSSTNRSLDARRHRHQSENEYLHKLFDKPRKRGKASRSFCSQGGNLLNKGFGLYQTSLAVLHRA